MKVGQYKGVDITKSCGYYYPSVNGDIECKNAIEVRQWIDNVWVQYLKNMEWIKKRMLQ